LEKSGKYHLKIAIWEIGSGKAGAKVLLQRTAGYLNSIIREELSLNILRIH